MTPDDQEAVKAALDILSVSVLAGWFVGALPVIATGLTVVWTGIRIYETKTVQAWLERRRGPKVP